MGDRNGHGSFEDMLDGLLADQPTVQGVVLPHEVCEGIPVEIPSRVAQEQKWFIKLSWRLFTQLAPLRGKALAVYMLVWREGLMYCSSEITLTSTSLRLCGLTRHEKAQALTFLEDAGLITVTRQRGKNPQVTVLALVGRFGRKPTTRKRGS